MRPYELLIAALLALALLGGCEKEQTPAPTASPKTSAKPPAKAVAPPTAAVPLPKPEEAKLVYSAEGRRDPFLPLVGKKVAAFSENPLENFDLIQYKLKGLIIGLGDPKAIVVAPDGKSYILKEGMRIGKSNGIIRDINREKILVEEQYQDLTGKTHTNMQEILVPKREGV